MGESFQVQFFDGCLFVRTLLFFGIERAIRITVFTVKFLLATWCMTIFAQVDGVTAAAPYGNHARFLLLSGTTWHDTIYQSLLDHYPRIEIVHPLLHLFRRNQARVSDHGGENARLMDARTPQLQSQWGVPAAIFGDASQHRDRDPERLCRID